MALEFVIDGATKLPKNGLLIRIPNNYLKEHLAKEEALISTPTIGAEITMESMPARNTTCANCDGQFERRRDTGGARYSWKILKRIGSPLEEKSDFVCTKCYIILKKEV